MEYGLVLATAGALLVRVGLALNNCGLVRAKNAGGSMARHIADLCLASLAFWAIGLAILNPERAAAVIDARQIFGVHYSQGEIDSVHFYFGAEAALRGLVLVLLACAIVVGALAERMRFWPMVAASLLMGAIIVPLLARWAMDEPRWRGWFHDYAGASYVHLAGAACAAVGALLVGPRAGKYNRDGSSNMMPGHNLPLAGLGTLLMVVGWLPYLAMMAQRTPVSVAMICLNALLAAAAGGAASLAVGHVRYGKPDISLVLCGVLAALVAITAGADVMSNGGAVLTGAIAGVLVPLLMLQIDLVWKVDDPTSAVAIHGVGGLWGLLAAAIFAVDLPVREHLKLLAGQAVAALIVIGVSGGAALMLFGLMKRMSRLRVREADEFDGLDLAEHDIGSYPDFQQTMIKSYHLREA